LKTLEYQECVAGSIDPVFGSSCGLERDRKEEMENREGSYLLLKRLMSLTKMVELLHADEGRNYLALVWCEREI
jgi:hypothetical protein